jgi:hypothetical protein
MITSSDFAFAQFFWAVDFMLRIETQLLNISLNMGDLFLKETHDSFLELDLGFAKCTVR